MRIVYEIDDDVQTCASIRGDYVDLTAVVLNDGDVLNLEGTSKHLRQLLTALMDCLDCIDESQAMPQNHASNKTRQ